MCIQKNVSPVNVSQVERLMVFNIQTSQNVYIFQYNFFGLYLYRANFVLVSKTQYIFNKTFCIQTVQYMLLHTNCTVHVTAYKLYSTCYCLRTVQYMLLYTNCTVHVTAYRIYSTCYCIQTLQYVTAYELYSTYYCVQTVQYMLLHTNFTVRYCLRTVQYILLCTNCTVHVTAYKLYSTCYCIQTVHDTAYKGTVFISHINCLMIRKHVLSILHPNMLVYYLLTGVLPCHSYV